MYELDERHEEELLLTTLVQCVQDYRRNVLYAGMTYFHRPICTMIQEFMDSIESLDMLRDDDATNAGTDKEEPHAHVLEAIRNHLDEAVTEYLLDGYAWRGKLFRFAHLPMDVLIERLGMLNEMFIFSLETSCIITAWSGVLDCTVPKVVYAMGAKVTCHGPLKSTLLYIGYTFDMMNDNLE
jgi:hypothetical protein